MQWILGALIAAALALGMARVQETQTQISMDNIRATATAQQMMAISNAAQEYISDNYAAVEAVATAATPATITIAMLEAQTCTANGTAVSCLAPSFSATDPYSQTWSVQVLQPSAGILQALGISSGGVQIQASTASEIAAEATKGGGGFIPYNNQAGDLSSSTAVGAYGSYTLPMAGYTNPGAGHVVFFLAFNNGNLLNNYLYRVAVPGQPQLNTMSTVLNMGNNNVTNANNVNANGQVDVTSNANVFGLNGTAQLSATNPVAGQPIGIALNNSGTNWGVRLQSNPGDGNWLELTDRNGAVQSSWNAGNYSATGTITPGALANQGWGCSPNGAIAANANGTGTLMSCVSGAWQSVGGSSAFSNSYQMGVGNGAWYQNTSGSPMFVASRCNPTPDSSGYVENVTMEVYNTAGTEVSWTDGQQQEGGSDANFQAIPSASAMVPPNFWYSVSGYQMSCDVMITD